jgi:hypothetical protein
VTPKFKFGDRVKITNDSFYDNAVLHVTEYVEINRGVKDLLNYSLQVTHGSTVRYTNVDEEFLVPVPDLRK